MVSPSRAAAGADPAGPVPRADRPVGTDGQRHRSADRADDDAGRADRRRPGLRLRDPARRAHAGADRCAVCALPAAPLGHDARRGRPKVGSPARDGAVRVRAAVRRQRLLRDRRGRDRRIRVCRGPGDMADVYRYRFNCAVGVQIRMASGGGARHFDEPCAAAADADRGGVLHRRAVAAGGPDDP